MNIRDAWRNLFPSLPPEADQRNAELDEEITAHLRMAARDRMERGATPQDAQAAAQREFGNTGLVKEVTRDMWGWTSFERLMQDLKFGLRVFRRNPGFTAVAVLTLALGIGANTAIFSVVNGLLIRSLPFHDAKQLVWIMNSDGEGGLSSTTSRTFNFRDFEHLNRTFSSMGAYNAFFASNSYNLTGAGEPERLTGVNVTQGFFRMLGVSPELGRSFVSEECVRTGPPAVMLSHGFWNAKYGADPSIVGKSIQINGYKTTVVGVLPESFSFASIFTPGVHVDIFIPLFVDAAQDNDGDEVAIIGRLKPGASIGSARADIAAILKQLQQQDPNRWGLDAHMIPLEDYVTGRLRPALVVLVCAVGFVLLIACANLSNLLLARAAARRKEIALRIAVGAGRFRLIRQMLTESVTLSFMGGLLGLPLAWWGTHALSTMRGSTTPLLGQISIDRRAFLFTLLLSMLAGIFFGMIPAFQASRADVNDTLKETTAGAGGARRDWTRNVLVVSEVALALILLGGAGLMMRSFLKLMDTDLGFRPEHIAVVRVDPGPEFNTNAKLIAYQKKILARVREIPGVEAASLTDAVPLDRDRGWVTGIVGVDYSKTGRPGAYIRVIAPGYFDTMKIRLLQGRTFTDLDSAGHQEVVVINRSLSRALFHDTNPLGRQILVGSIQAQVIGVVDDVRHSALDQAAGLEFYRSYQQEQTSGADLVVRTTLAPDAFLPTLRRAIWSFAPNQPLAEARTLDQLIDTAVSSRKFTVLLLAIFAGLALLLASIGIYGVISYSAVQRTREMGIRMALGANGLQLQWQIVREAVTLTLAGTFIGMTGLVLLSRYLRSLLFEVTPNDPATLAAITTLLIAVAATASYLPARRASRIDPVAALRFE